MSTSDPVLPPESHVDLLTRPVFATLATVRPDGSPQNSMMWFDWSGTRLRFTHTSTRQKFANLAAEPRVSVVLGDPTNPYRYLEVRGVVDSIEPDPGAEFYLSLQRRYSVDYDVIDPDIRVVISVLPTRYVRVHGGGLVKAE